MISWNPAQYLKFADHRFRPAIDLLARIDAAAPRAVCDLGCGTGHLTLELKKRWPDADVFGVDSSPDMLAKAREVAPGLSFAQADAGNWRPEKPLDVIFSNAVLHWLPDHGKLFPRLLGLLEKGGVLAVQMPANHQSPSHRLLSEAAANGPWKDRLAAVQGIHPVHDPDFYYRALAPAAQVIDAWESEYLHVLSGDDPIVEWTRGTALRPYLDALEGPQRDAFLAEYRRLVTAAYPREPDGSTLFPFRRVFVVARRA
ncbi:MAG TPA: trans-aconitate 2-methyltransferase [Dongiaceae bacterium]|jgi:trans-aconitate 2-methyltransferase